MSVAFVEFELLYVSFVDVVDVVPNYYFRHRSLVVHLIQLNLDQIYTIAYDWVV